MESQKEALRREMEEQKGGGGVAKDVFLNDEFSMDADVNCTIAQLTCDAKTNRTDLEMSQMHEELSFENELKLLELVISNPDGNHVLLPTESKETICPTDNLQPCRTETSVSLAKTEFSQNEVPKKNSHRKGDVMILKALSDKAWENEKRKQESSKKDSNDMPNIPSSSDQKTTPSGLQENQALWLNDVKKHFEVFPGHHSCKKCKFIITHNFTMEDRLHPRGSNCELCSKALFHNQGINNDEEELLPICNLCKNLLKHLYKHEVEKTSLPRFICISCDQPFEEQTLYIHHVKKHRKRLLKCSLCSMYFTSRYDMGDHIRLHIRDGSYFSRRPKVEREKSLYNLLS